VAVLVVDHAPGREGRGVEPGLLLQLPSGRLDRGLSWLDLPARELPEAPEQPPERAGLHEPPSPPSERHHGGVVVRPGPSGPPSGDLRGVR